MTRSHVLLHCPEEKVKATRDEAWEGKTSGSIRVVLSNPRWEKRLLGFLELLGVRRVMNDGTDKDETRAARLDGWVIWEVGEWAVSQTPV